MDILTRIKKKRLKKYPYMQPGWVDGYNKALEVVSEEIIKERKKEVITF